MGRNFGQNFGMKYLSLLLLFISTPLLADMGESSKRGLVKIKMIDGSFEEGIIYVWIGGYSAPSMPLKIELIDQGNKVIQKFQHDQKIPLQSMNFSKFKPQKIRLINSE